MAEAKPVFSSVKEYFEAMEDVTLEKTAVTYNEDGSMTVSYK